MEQEHMKQGSGVVIQKQGAMNLEALRFSYDAQLARKIFQTFGHPALGAAPSKSALLDLRRRHLLGDAVLITPELMPDVSRAFTQCLRALGLSEHTGGLYVQQCAEYNANVMSDGSRFDIVVNSGLLRDFSIPELRFVIGHELGHVLYQHSDISLRGLFEEYEEIAEADALMLFRWSRSAEISADRVGLVCAGGSEPAVSAMFKISSGLSGIPIEAVRRSMLHQFEQLKLHLANADTDDHNDLIRTHPMSPIRFRSIELAVKHIATIFSSDTQRKPASLVKLDQNIEALLEAIESDNPAARGFQAAEGQEVLGLAMIYVALASGIISAAHQTFLREVFVAIDAKFSIERLIQSVGHDWRGFRDTTLGELKEAVEAELLTRDELTRALILIDLMIASSQATAIFQIALDDLARCFGVDLRDLPRSSHPRMSHALVRDTLKITMTRPPSRARR